jgi:hypothetical protein
MIASLLDRQIDDSVIGLFAIVGTFAFLIIAVVAISIRKAAQTRAREETKREIAAYIAEGSMKPEDAERILRSDVRKWGC